MWTKPVLGTRAWFGPRRLGWGLSPVTPEGWAVTGAGVAAVVAALASNRRHAWIALAVVAALLAVIFLKGTSPGGPRAWEEYQDSKRDR